MKEISETSFGIIPLVFQNGRPYAFIVKKSHGNFWAFPKGHPEKGETLPIETAQRELKEETSLDVLEVYSEEPYKERYVFFKEEAKINKTVLLFVARTTTEYKIDYEEIIDAKWIPLDELDCHLTYEESKNIARQLKKRFLTH